jgi:hypothetical protein
VIQVLNPASSGENNLTMRRLLPAIILLWATSALATSYIISPSSPTWGIFESLLPGDTVNFQAGMKILFYYVIVFLILFSLLISNSQGVYVVPDNFFISVGSGTGRVNITGPAQWPPVVALIRSTVSKHPIVTAEIRL